jgi:hypothetical protein
MQHFIARSDVKVMNGGFIMFSQKIVVARFSLPTKGIKFN